jgi:hypothetical protein
MLLSRKGKKAQATGCFGIEISRTGDPSREKICSVASWGLYVFHCSSHSTRSSLATMIAGTGKTILRYHVLYALYILSLAMQCICG